MTDDHGMVPRERWEQTSVHKASTYYCAKCGKQFASPHDVYEHLETDHPSREERRAARRRRTPA